jgi:hypothetical protein
MSCAAEIRSKTPQSKINSFALIAPFWHFERKFVFRPRLSLAQRARPFHHTPWHTVRVIVLCGSRI